MYFVCVALSDIKAGHQGGSGPCPCLAGAAWLSFSQVVLTARPVTIAGDGDRAAVLQQVSPRRGKEAS